MLAQLQQFVNNLNRPKYWLLLANILLVFFLIILNNQGIIPLRTGDFIFFAILTLAFALYRPGWAFLFFIGIIPLENINLAPMELGIAIRPYQFIGALTITALIIRLLSGKLNFKLIKLEWYDWLIIIMNFGGLLSLINAPNKLMSLKLSIISATFVALYFLVRNYIQNSEDLKKIIPFFLSSSIIVVFYGIWQNIWFLRGLNGFEAMPGRPNGTFVEADWLGIFITLTISILYVLIYKITNYQLPITNEIQNLKLQIPNKFQNHKSKILNLYLFLFLTLCFIVLILTVSRSAWLGAFVSLIVFLSIVFFDKLSPREWQWRKTIQMKIMIVPAFIIAVLAVYVFHLTNFQLFNRVQSTGSGLQKITVSCEKNISLPESVDNISELEKYSCQHINLEEINFEKTQGKYVAEIYRQDPNVNIRAEIYQKSWQEIKNHWILGIGWGSIEQILGKDGRGTNLNSSNIFLEIWLGSGLLGIASFLAIILYILLNAAKNYYLSKNNPEKIISLFLIVSWFAIIIPNLFNAGIFLGFLWVWLGISQIKNNTI